MTGRELVIQALTFAGPERAPRDLWALPAVQLADTGALDELRRRYPMDIEQSQVSPGSSAQTIQSTAIIGKYLDDWGSVWERAEPGVIGEVVGPVVAQWSALASLRPPRHLFAQRDRDHVNRACEANHRFVLSDVTARPFERIQFLCGTEKAMMELADGSLELRRLLALVHEYYLEDIAWWCRTGVDGIMMMDDWGTNTALLISPLVWRELFKPLYREYCDLIHRAGKFAFFHSDGHIAAIMGDLIEAGVDALNSQLFCMDIEALARQFRGKVTFWGEIDRQHALAFGTPADVRAAVMRVRRALDDGRGGLIAQCEWGKGNTLQNIAAVYEAWCEPRPL